jgi:hypothetical protein
MKTIKLIATLLLFALAGGAAAVEKIAAQNTVVLMYDPRVSDLRIAPPPELELVRKGVLQAKATLSINYLPAGTGQFGDTCIAWPEQPKAAFTYAANLWASQLQSPVPITIDACWANNLSPGVLGHAGAQGFFRNFPGAPATDTWYPSALANALRGSDLDAAKADIYAGFSSTFSWYFGTDGNTPANQLDFASVILHEIGHGLGFLGSMQVSNGQGSWGSGSGLPFAYDRYTENGSGQALINTSIFPNPSAALATQLTGNSIFFDGPNANAGNGGARVPLHAPTTWSGGSSYSHLAESYNGTPNALMTFSLASGESLHSPGPVMLGMFKDMGWTLQTAAGNNTLTVTKDGTGSGTVTSSPAGINCGGTCAADFAPGTSVTLTATTGSGATFGGWGGSCTGTGACTVSMTSAKTVTATFNGCGYTITPTSASVAAGASTSFFSVTTTASCPWTAASGASWITSTSTGTGSGTITYSVAANTGTTSRTGTLTVGGQAFTITQAAPAVASSNLFVNGDFESGATGWVQAAASGTIITNNASAAHLGGWYAWLGGYDSAADSLHQDVAIPAAVTSASLRYWYRIETAETSTNTVYDTFVVTIQNPSSGAVLATLASLSNLNATSGWVQSAQFDVSSFKGQTIRLKFTAATDASAVTSFRVDDVTLAATTTTPVAYPLSVIRTGTGSGTVTSVPAGINCGTSCAANFNSGTSVTLTAAAASGSIFTGWSGGGCSGTGPCSLAISAAGTVTATFASSTSAGNLGPSPTSLAFGGQSLNTTAPGLAVTFANTGGAAVTVSSVTVSTSFAVSANNCATVNPGASCTVSVTFTPTAQGSLVGTLSLVSSAGALSVPLTGTGEKSLVTHYYRSILRRAPDAGGKSFWDSEAARVQALGVNVNEVWYAMAGSFYFSAEYAAFSRDNAGFVTDLYGTFFNRAPDAAGFNDWTSQLAAGMPREVVLASFMFSAEFGNFTQGIFGTAVTRKEIDTVGDFYRGLLARLPDDGGFNFWLQKFRAAQCQGSAAVTAQAESISSQFALGSEYAARARTNAQYVGDLYNAILRRGGDLAGVQYWINQIATGARSRENVRQAFLASAEFSGRVSAIIAQGCLP